MPREPGHVFDNHNHLLELDQPRDWQHYRTVAIVHLARVGEDAQVTPFRVRSEDLIAQLSNLRIESTHPSYQYSVIAEDGMTISTTGSMAMRLAQHEVFEVTDFNDRVSDRELEARRRHPPSVVSDFARTMGLSDDQIFIINELIRNPRNFALGRPQINGSRILSSVSLGGSRIRGRTVSTAMFDEAGFFEQPDTHAGQRRQNARAGLQPDMEHMMASLFNALGTAEPTVRTRWQRLIDESLLL